MDLNLDSALPNLALPNLALPNLALPNLALPNLAIYDEYLSTVSFGQVSCVQTRSADFVL